MKKVSIITVHVGSNFGSNLQAIATSEVLKSLGFDPTIINYVPPRVTYWRYLVDMIKQPSRIIFKTLFFPSFVRNKHIYNSFLAKHVKITKPIHSSDDFVKVCPKADYYMTGSDQVWNHTWNEGLDKHYYFEGISGEKLSYAASIGSPEVSEEQKTYMLEYLKEYKAISVREKSAKELLNSWGVKAEQHIDPTFMLDKEKWKKFMSPRLIEKPYVLVYIPYNITDKELIYKSVRKIACEKSLTVVAFSWGYWKEKLADETIQYASPGDFLSLMNYAEYIVTNSFHGTAFSINLNKQFWVYLPSGFSTRVTSLLNLCNLQSRLLDEQISSDKIAETIDYKAINVVLDKERGRALVYLQKNLRK